MDPNLLASGDAYSSEGIQRQYDAVEDNESLDLFVTNLLYVYY